MRLSYDACWQTIASLLRAHADVLFVIAGVFLLLPLLAQTIYLPPPVLSSFSPAAFEAFLGYYQSNIVPVLLVRLATLTGTGCLTALLLARDAPTVGEAIRRATQLLPALFLADVLLQILVAIGLIALILPGLYLIARSVLTAPAIMAENIRNPVRALQRSFALTQNLGWQIFGLIFIIMAVAWIGTSAILTVAGVVFQLALPQEAASLVRAMIGALSPTIMMLIYALMSAGLYRQVVALKSGM